MQKNSENKIGAEELSEFMDLSHKESMVCVKAHTNILVWGEDSQEQELRGKVSSALAGMNIIYILAEENPIPLSAEQLAAYAALHTLSPSTTIYNDADSYMEVKYMAKGG